MVNSTTLRKILQVETGYITELPQRRNFQIDVLDYKIYENVPQWWRNIEKLLRLDIYLTLKARSKAKDYDIIWAGSEKVGIPLSFLRVKKPLVVIAHHLESSLKSKLLRFFGVPRKWSGVGYTSIASKNFFVSYLRIPESATFQCYAANYLNKVKTVPPAQPNGNILSIGVAKRDYQTLIKALAQLDRYQTKIFVSSKFGDQLKSTLPTKIPNWVQFPGYVTDEELLQEYIQARFVVVPLLKTDQGGAGTTAFLEAAACGKAVIATRTKGTLAIIEHGVNGLLVPPNDFAAMQDAIQTLWNQPELAEKLGAANRHFIESHFNPKIVSNGINAFLKTI